MFSLSYSLVRWLDQIANQLFFFLVFIWFSAFINKIFVVLAKRSDVEPEIVICLLKSSIESLILIAIIIHVTIIIISVVTAVIIYFVL